MTSRLRPLIILAALLAAAAAVPGLAQQVKVPPAPDRWVTDEAGFLARDTVAALDARLAAFERGTGHQVLVYVGRTTGGVPIEDWAVKAFEAWKVGRKGLDDGLVLFIMAEDRTVRIEVGYGLEERVPDIQAYRIISGVLVPGFRSGRPDQAVTEAVSNILALIGGEAAPLPPEERRGEPSAFERGRSIVGTIFVVIVVVLFLILLITHPALALWLLFNIFSGGGRGGGGWGGGGGFGGGFSGGGGRSGGGGASGSW